MNCLGQQSYFVPGNLYVKQYHIVKLYFFQGSSEFLLIRDGLTNGTDMKQISEPEELGTRLNPEIQSKVRVIA